MTFRMTPGRTPAPLGSKVFTVEVSEIGATEFSATITFTLTSETLVLTMTGTRVAVFPFEPSLPLLEGLRCLEYVKKHFNWENINERLFIAPCVDGATLCEFQDGVFGALIYSRDDSYDNYNIYLDYLNERS